jgi:hypothetical protein
MLSQALFDCTNGRQNVMLTNLFQLRPLIITEPFVIDLQLAIAQATHRHLHVEKVLQGEEKK